LAYSPYLFTFLLPTSQNKEITMSAVILAFPKKAPVKEFQPLAIVKHNEFGPLDRVLEEIRIKNKERHQQALVVAARLADQAKWARLRMENQQLGVV